MQKKIRAVTKRQPTESERLLIAKKTGGRCHVCGDKLHPHWEADHVVPYKLGGTSKLSNLLPICKECNILRKARRPATIRKILRLGAYARSEARKDTKLGELIRAELVPRHRESKAKFRNLKRKIQEH
jgi:5-methylcytosine-specific restriction endonuclease McrA